MKRRDFSLQLAATGLGLAVAGTVRAQGAPVEGKNYVKLNTPAPVSLPGPDKKVEVVEFFGYWCPHCYAFESTLEAWVKRLPADVAFRRVPVAFSVPQQALQKAYYALEDMGQVGTMHRKIFAAIHQQNRRLGTESEIFEFVGSQGVDLAKFREAFSSFSASTRASRARQLSQDYKIDGVPTLGVQGRFFTSGSLSGGNDRMVAVADFLIDRARQGG
jgi:protein dithiol oxidoreductase (disulfide-forming)